MSYKQLKCPKCKRTFGVNIYSATQRIECPHCVADRAISSSGFTTASPSYTPSDWGISSSDAGSSSSSDYSSGGGGDYGGGGSSGDW